MSDERNQAYWAAVGENEYRIKTAIMRIPEICAHFGERAWFIRSEMRAGHLRWFWKNPKERAATVAAVAEWMKSRELAAKGSPANATPVRSRRRKAAISP